MKAFVLLLVVVVIIGGSVGGAFIGGVAVGKGQRMTALWWPTSQSPVAQRMLAPHRNPAVSSSYRLSRSPTSGNRPRAVS